MKTNIFVEYDGGGYDGCIWEYNYFYIDKTGKFYTIYSSGTGGIKTKHAAMLLIDNDGNSFSTKVSVYHLDNEVELEDFAKTSACPNVLAIVRWFNEHNDPDAEPFAICSQCESKIPCADEIHLIDIHGCGGLMSTADNIICSDCYTTCDSCGEYSRDIMEYEDEYLCEYCVEDRQQQKIFEDQRDLLFQSLATGTPDMFSDEMRWFWGAV